MPFTLLLQGSKVSPVTLSGHLEVPPPQFEEDGDMDFEDVDDEDEQEAALRERLLGKKRSLQQMKAETEKPTKGRKQASKDAEEGATRETGKAEEDEAPALVEEAKESQDDEPPTKRRKTEGNNGDKKSPTGGSPEEHGAGKGKQKKKDWVTMKNGLKFRDMKVGTGQPIRNGQRAGVFYVGQLQDKKVFDKKLSEPAFEFTLGKGEVIKGWDQGVKGMKLGGKRRLEVPASLGYGDEGTDGIPPNSTLTFTVELKRIS
jgi:FK506-binding nuclear protein